MVDHIPNEYFLGSYLKPKPGYSDFQPIRPIAPNDFDNINVAMRNVGYFSIYCSLYEICEKNYRSILAYHNSIKDNYPSNRDRSQEYMGEAFQEMNRLLLNYLSSFKTFYDHFYTRYKKLKQQGYSFFDDYEKITSDCYDGSFSYRFFYKLRNYVQHCGMPIGEVMIYEQQTKDGNIDIQVSTSLNRDRLLNNYDSWGKVRAGLQKQPERMELIPYLNEFQIQIQLINRLVTDFEISFATDSWQILLGLVNEVQAQYPDGIPFISQYRKTVDSQNKVPIIFYFPIPEMLKFEEKLHITNNSIQPNAKSNLNRIKLNAKKYVELQDNLTIPKTNEQLDTQRPNAPHNVIKKNELGI